jgi:hypothetical protein
LVATAYLLKRLASPAELASQIVPTKTAAAAVMPAFLGIDRENFCVCLWVPTGVMKLDQ